MKKTTVHFNTRICASISCADLIRLLQRHGTDIGITVPHDARLELSVSGPYGEIIDMHHDNATLDVRWETTSRSEIGD